MLKDVERNWGELFDVVWTDMEWIGVKIVWNGTELLELGVVIDGAACISMPHASARTCRAKCQSEVSGTLAG